VQVLQLGTMSLLLSHYATLSGSASSIPSIGSDREQLAVRSHAESRRGYRVLAAMNLYYYSVHALASEESECSS